MFFEALPKKRTSRGSIGPPKNDAPVLEVFQKRPSEQKGGGWGLRANSRPHTPTPPQTRKTDKQHTCPTARHAIPKGRRIKLDWIGLETRRDTIDEIRSRAEIRISQMPTTAGRQFFFGSVQKLSL